jgi:hypothetical protein
MLGTAVLVVVGFAGAGVPAGIDAGGWLLAGAVISACLTGAYVTLLRYDLTMVPVAVATMVGVGALAQGAQRAYPGALTGSVPAAALADALGWLWFRAIRRARRQDSNPGPSAVAAEAS